jgi:uncharacterized phage-associated protein
MSVTFSTVKAIQAAAVLLKEHGGQMSRLRLLKLLYIASRTSLMETLRPITGERIAAMDHGPVPSSTYDLLKRKHTDAPLWDKFIEQVGPQEHKLVCDPGVDELSQYEIDLLHKVSEERRDADDYAIAVETHEFEEWKQNKPPKGGRKWVPFDDLLAALQLEDSRPRIQEAIADDLAFDEALAAVRKQNAVAVAKQ